MSFLHCDSPSAGSTSVPYLPQRTCSRDFVFDDPNHVDVPKRTGLARVGRYALYGVLGAAAACAVTAELVETGLASHLDSHHGFHRTRAIGKAVELDLIPQRPYIHDEHCLPGKGICICSDGYHAVGRDEHGYNKIRKVGAGSTGRACQQWHFKVGDVILVEKPSAMERKYIPAMVVAAAQNSPVVHAAIVTQVPPAGIAQTADNIVVTEALKGVWKQVVQNTFRELVERFPFGGISLRRVDEKRYPRFFSSGRQNEITQWAISRLGDGFDHAMLIPLKRRLTASEYVPINPSCSDRRKAVEKYHEGGPGKWICSEFVAWTLAFAGGLNLEYGSLSDDCELPPWTIPNVQPFPGELVEASYFDPTKKFHMPCADAGCFVSVPSAQSSTSSTTSIQPTTTPATTSDTQTSSSSSSRLRGSSGSQSTRSSPTTTVTHSPKEQQQDLEQRAKLHASHDHESMHARQEQHTSSKSKIPSGGAQMNSQGASVHHADKGRKTESSLSPTSISHGNSMPPMSHQTLPPVSGDSSQKQQTAVTEAANDSSRKYASDIIKVRETPADGADASESKLGRVHQQKSKVVIKDAASDDEHGTGDVFIAATLGDAKHKIQKVSS